MFTEESNPTQYVKLVASGEVDGTLLEALEDYVKRQKKRLEGLGLGNPPEHVRNQPARPRIAEALSDIGDEQE